MKVLLIHQSFVGPQESGGTRHYEFGRRLVDAGHEFTIVASDISYHTGRRVVDRPSLMTAQTLGGIRVLRAYTYPSLHRSFAWRVVSFLSFMVTSIWAALRAGPVDVVMSTSPPIFQLVSAWLVAAIRRRPLLVEIRDLWPEFAIDMGILRNRPLIAMSRWFERFIYRRAAHLLVNSPAYRDYLIDKGVPPEKITLIPNGVDPGMFDPGADGRAFRQRWNLDGKFVVTYAGALGAANDIDTILRAADRLRGRRDLHFLLVGDGKERHNLERKAAEMRLDAVTFTGACPKQDMAGVLAASDVCLATLRNIPMFRTTYPNKVFDYMAAGRPVVLGIDGVIRQVVEAAASGLFVTPGDDAALAAAVEQLRADPALATQMGRSGRFYVCEHFNREQHASQFVQLCRAVAEKGVASKWYRRWGKRALDLVVSVPAFVALLPLLAVVALLVRWRLGSPVLFRQERAGAGERLFHVVKFRSMLDARDGQGNLLPDAERLTGFGKFLRATSLDELPSLWNVVRGDMSLVGPRPLFARYLGRYSTRQRRRHEVRPGVTGWAQVNGRNLLSWGERFEHDVWYVDHVSFWLDLKILFRTLLVVFRRVGISAEGDATMPEFMGNAPAEPSFVAQRQTSAARRPSDAVLLEQVDG